jgi:hypothetical protein
VRFEIDIYSPNDVRAFAQFLLSVADGAEVQQDAKEAAYGQQKLGAALGQALGDSLLRNHAGEEIDGQTEVAGPAPATEAPKRTRGRPRKETAAPEPTPKPEQTEEPEVEGTESASEMPDDIFDSGEPEDTLYPPTRDGLKAAMQAHAAKFGMAETQKHGPALLGAAKFSEVPDDGIAAAVARFVAAIAEGA